MDGLHMSTQDVKHITTLIFDHFGGVCTRQVSMQCCAGFLHRDPDFV